MEKETFIQMNQVHVGGGKVDIKGGVYINVRIETTGSTWEELHDALGAASSPRVKVQAKLRQKSVEELKRLSRIGYKVRLKDLGIRSTPQARVVKVLTLADALEEFKDVDNFIQACEDAGWMAMTSREHLVNLHLRHYEKKDRKSVV